MAADKLSAREAALIAQARAQLGKTAAAPAAEQPSTPASAERAAPAADTTTTPAPGADTERRIAALMAAARAESERLRERRHRLYVWVPTAFASVVGLWALLWMWHRL